MRVYCGLSGVSGVNWGFRINMGGPRNSVNWVIAAPCSSRSNIVVGEVGVGVVVGKVGIVVILVVLYFFIFFQ